MACAEGAVEEQYKAFIPAGRLGRPEEAAPFDVQVTLPTPFPGTPFYHQLKRQGRLLEDGAWEKCTLFDLNFRPSHMTEEELRQGFRDLVVKLYGEAFTQYRHEAFKNQRVRRAAVPA